MSCFLLCAAVNAHDVVKVFGNGAMDENGFDNKIVSSKKVLWFISHFEKS